MILEFLITIIFNLFESIFSGIPDITWSIDTPAMQIFLDVVRVAGYMLPGDAVIVVASLVFWFTLFRIGVAILKFILQFTPFG